MECLTLTNREATFALGQNIGQQLVAGAVLV